MLTFRRTVSQYNATDMDGATSFDNSDEVFAYENGRLVKKTVSGTGNSGNLNYTLQYQYNEAGQLVKRLDGYNNSVSEFEYSCNIVSKITESDAAGNTTMPLVQYNNEGLLVRSIVSGGGYSDERRYTYTDEGLIARYELFSNGNQADAILYEYDNKEYPRVYVNANPKGHPVVPSTQSPFRYKRNVLKLSRLAPSADGTGWQAHQTTVNDLVYNDKGYPTEVNARILDGTGKVAYTSASTFEYTNCE